jgi:hypothetical protein
MFGWFKAAKGAAERGRQIDEAFTLCEMVLGINARRAWEQMSAEGKRAMLEPVYKMLGAGLTVEGAAVMLATPFVSALTSWERRAQATNAVRNWCSAGSLGDVGPQLQASFLRDAEQDPEDRADEVLAAFRRPR